MSLSVLPAWELVRGGGEALCETAGVSDVREVAASWPDGGGRLGEHLAQPRAVAGLWVGAGDDEVGHCGVPDCRKGGGGEAGEFADWLVEDLAPVRENEVLAGPAAGPHQLLRGLGQELDVHACLEHLPDVGEGGPAELVGERLDQGGEAAYLQWLVDVDDAAGGVLGGI